MMRGACGGLPGFNKTNVKAVIAHVWGLEYVSGPLFHCQTQPLPSLSAAWMRMLVPVRRLRIDGRSHLALLGQGKKCMAV